MRQFDLAPLYRNTVGFDRLFTMLDQLGGVEAAPTYPPYNIERTGENAYRISVAVAGFTSDDLNIEVKENLLTVQGRKARTSDTVRNLAMAAGFFLFSGFYVWTGKIIYHAICFGLIILLIIIRCHYLFYTDTLSPEKCGEWRYRGRWALALLAFGYGLWHVDLEFCAELRALREQIGLPWAWLLELHGWWHLGNRYFSGNFEF